MDGLINKRDQERDDEAGREAEITSGTDENTNDAPTMLVLRAPPLVENGDYINSATVLADWQARRKALNGAEAETARETALPLAMPVETAPTAKPQVVEPKALLREEAKLVPLRVEERNDVAPYKVKPRKRSLVGLGFLLFVCVPTALVYGYFGYVAKKEYGSEFRFSVIEQTTALPSSAQSPSNSISGSTGSGLASMAAALTGGASGQSSGAVQNYMIVDYVQSPAVVDALQKKIDIAKLLSRGSNQLIPAPRNPTPEQLYAEWQRAVSAYYDPVTGLAYVKVRAFSAADSLLISSTLMTMSEGLINQIANRSNEDAVRFAEKEVGRARDRVTEAAKLMKEYRNSDQVINPGASVVQANITLMTTLRQSVAQLQTQMDSLLGQNFTKNSPTVKNVAAQLNSAKAELRRVEKEVTSERDGNGALSSVVGRYETLDLNRQYANLAYTNAMLALDQTRANAAAQHIYLTPYSQPILPRSADGPKVIKGTITAFFAIFFSWLILLMILRSIKEARV